MKKQEMQERVTVDVDTTAVDTLSAELAAAVAPQSDLNQAPAEELFDKEKKLDEELELSEGQIQAEAVVASTDAAAAAVVVDTTAATSGIGGGAASADGGVSPLVWAGGALLTAGAIVVATDDDDDNGGSKSTPTPTNSAPVAAAAKAISADQDGGAVSFSIQATDADQDALTYSISGQPANGQVTSAGANQFTYTPKAGFSGSDTFDIVISDGKETVTQKINVTVDPTPGGNPGAFTLTSGTDIATADTFDAPMVFTPDGSDRILSLQDEDVLTGTAGKTDNTLNATIGQQNDDEGTSGTVTPKLVNIQNINIDWTGDTTNLDLRNADSTKSINIQRVTGDANDVTVSNIGTVANDLRVANSGSKDVNVEFQFKDGILSGSDALALELDDVVADTVKQDARGVGAAQEGFRTVNLNAVNGVDLDMLTVNQMQSLIVTGSGNLRIVDLTPDNGGGQSREFFDLGNPGINNPAAFGLVSLDGSAFTGNMTLDITKSLGGFNDPSNSGAKVHGVVKGGTGNDTFWSSKTATGTTATNRDVIDGGAGNNIFATTAGVSEPASFVNIQTLELRQQNGAQTVDFDAFDSALTKVLMRGEEAGTPVFNLNDLGATLAGNGLTLRHGITNSNGATVNALLKNANGANDTIAITVENDLNTKTTFDYTLNFDGDNADGDSDKADGVVENVTIHDNDTESNIVTLTKGQEHTGTVTLDGGVAGQTFTVKDPLVAKVIDASGQKSDLRISVGDTVAPIANVDQDIRLGTGNDILTFVNPDDFTGGDKISDAGGNDTVRAAFSKDSNLVLTDIENLHIIASQNVKLGMANADVDNLVILANIAADGGTDNSPLTAEPFNVAGVQTTDVITLTDTKLTELNFSADLDTDDTNNNLTDTVDSNEVYDAIFNGVTLANNSANALTVNINSALDIVDTGARSYTLGQLTAHGVTSMAIKVADEDVETVKSAFNKPVTTINNIYGIDMTALSLSAKGEVNVGIVSGAPLANSLNSFDSTAVGGKVTARVISLGDSATVNIGNGGSDFNALGSAGNGIKIVAGNGINKINGSAQSDRITTGSNWDEISGDRGNNVMNSGAGNDALAAKDGNDTYDVGTGINTVVDNKDTNISANLATTVVALGGAAAAVTSVQLHTDGGAVATSQNMLAVGAGSNLSIRWTGNDLQTNSAVLDGRLAEVNANTTTDNSDLSIYNNAIANTFTGGIGNDVAMFDGSAAGSGLNFNGGAGNDAAVGSINSDIFTGGTGADVLVMQDTSTSVALDGDVDRVVIADGESTASAWDIVVGFQSDAGASSLAAVVGGLTPGSDVLDLVSTSSFVGGTGVFDNAQVGTFNGTDSGLVKSHSINADGLATFSKADIFAVEKVGTATGQISLADALSYLAANVTGSKTVAFQYDSNGDGSLTSVDSTFVFQDGNVDTVVELAGLYAGITGIAEAGNFIHVG